MIGPGVCRLVNVGVFQPGGLCMGFLCVCVRQEWKTNKRKPVLFKNGAMQNYWLVIYVADSTTAKLLVGELIQFIQVYQSI